MKGPSCRRRRHGRGWLRARSGAWLLPYFNIAIGIAIGIHGGTAVHLPSHVEQVHHRILGGCLVVGGVVLALTQGGVLGPRAGATCGPAS